MLGAVMTQRHLLRLFSLIWRDHLWSWKPGVPVTVIKITGWRSCIYHTPGGQRVRATFYGWPRPTRRD